MSAVMRSVRFAASMLARDWRAGELRLLSAVVVVAVASVTTVAFFAERMKLALDFQANNLLGADMLVVSDRPLGAEFLEGAHRAGLATVQLVKFPSMALAGDTNVLAEIKAVDSGYPLRGDLRVGDTPLAEGVATREAPPSGSIWIDDKLAARLQVKKGETVTLGDRTFSVGGVIVQEPEAAVGFLSLGPRLIMNRADLAATGLIQPGSRVSYRLLVAGDPRAVTDYRNYAKRRVGPGQRVEEVGDARPEIRSALEKAQRFLGLSALSSVVLAAVAVALGARRYLQRHLDACAMMRCLGATQGAILRMHVLLFFMLGAGASAVGCLLGYGGQALLGALLANLIGVDLPLPGALPAVQGFLTGFVLLAGFGLPPVMALGRVPTLRVLRRDLGVPSGWGAAGYVAGVAMVAGLLLWEADDPRLGWYVLGGMAGIILLAALCSLVLLKLLSRAARGRGFAWRFGIANLERRRMSTLTQTAALGLGIMALLVLTLTRSDLLDNWKTTLPADAPNRFLVNIQPDQREPLMQLFTAAGLTPPEMFPMVRGRLTAINGKPVSSARYADDRARRLVDREFNLSWAARPRADNVIVAGRWWGDGDRDTAQLSVESGIAATLGLQLGDQLTYERRGHRTECSRDESAQGGVGFVPGEFLRHRAPRLARRDACQLCHQLPSAPEPGGFHDPPGAGVSQFPGDRCRVRARAHPEDDGPGCASDRVRVHVHPGGGPRSALRCDQRDARRAPARCRHPAHPRRRTPTTAFRTAHGVQPGRRRVGFARGRVGDRTRLRCVRQPAQYPLHLQPVDLGRRHLLRRNRRRLRRMARDA